MPALRTRDTQSRPLEVTTDAPQPPTLAIISPTPRAFTFPVSHNLADSPYSTPSNSPFEPDLRSLAITSPSSCTTPPPLMRTLSPDTSITSVSPSPSHKRRTSTSSDVERRPKKGDEDYIKRPENAFILFRRKCCEDRQQAEEEAAANGPTKKQRQADLSKMISQQWKGLSPEERQYWEELAKEKKKEHQRTYPGYVYRPKRVRDKDGKARNKKRKGKEVEVVEREIDTESMSYVLPPPRHHGRSASAPTPPPMSYQPIRIPNLYMTPSCPTSPSLLPMINRRSSASGNPEEVMSNFDYLPSEQHLMPPSFGQAGYEASLQSSNFLRSMFNMSSQTESTTGNAPQLQPLTLPTTDPSVLLPAHQIVSPVSPIGSGSSGPSSPATGPFTPTSTMLSHPSFSQLNAPSHSGCMPEPQSQAELDMQIQLSQDIDYSAYSWETNSVWQNESSMIMGNDFDMSAIPPIELGMPKYSHEPSYVSSSEAGIPEYGQEYQQQYAPAEYSQEYLAMEHAQYAEGGQNIEGLLGFDEMMAQAGQSF